MRKGLLVFSVTGIILGFSAFRTSGKLTDPDSVPASDSPRSDSLRRLQIALDSAHIADSIIDVEYKRAYGVDRPPHKIDTASLIGRSPQAHAELKRMMYEDSMAVVNEMARIKKWRADSTRMMDSARRADSVANLHKKK